MKLGQQLKIKQNQSLIMTPQLQQAIKLLQLNNLELTKLCLIHKVSFVLGKDCKVDVQEYVQ